MTSRPLSILACLMLAAGSLPVLAKPFAGTKPVAAPFEVEAMGQFEQPWAMAFLPDGRLLVTQKQGALKLVAPGSEAKPQDIAGVPMVAYFGQGGLGDVVLHPDHARNGLVYLSYAEPGDAEDLRGAAVARARLVLDPAGGGKLEGLEVIWRQQPKVTGGGHYGHRIAFGAGHLWISSGERQKFDPAQDLEANLGKVLRLTEDGKPAPGNPFAAQGKVAAEVWSLGHRNPLGLAFDGQGRLWDIEMGPKGGDELNLVEKGANYGYPLVSDGDHYDGRDIPDHDTRPDDFKAPALSWNPVISPGGMLFYSGKEFPDWQGDALVAGLSSEALVRIEFDGVQAREAARYAMGQRIREVEQGPDGKVWLLEDQDGGSGGRLLRLSAK